MKYLILFDIDGTIVRFKRRFAKRLFSQVVEEFFGKPVPEDVLQRFGGMTDLMILRIMAESIQVDNQEVLKRIDEIWERLYEVFEGNINKENLDILPGVESLIKHFHNDSNFALGLITGNFQKNAYKKVNVFDLGQFFPYGGFGSDYDDRAMLPIVAIQRANEYHGKELFNSDNTLIIGDTVRDINCAKANNIKILSVATGEIPYKELEEGNPDVLIDDLEDLNQSINTIHNILGYKI